jgi:hypothetical protein
MVHKHLTIKSVRGQKALLNYLVHDPERLKDKDGKAFVIRHNIRGESLESWIEEFADHELNRITTRSDSVYMNHIILSLHEEDNDVVTTDMLRDIAQHYIDIAADGGMAIAVQHREKDHAHVHIAVSGIDLEGRSLRMSKADFQRTKLEMETFQRERFPELVHSRVDHTRKTKTRENEQEPRTKKDRIRVEVEQIMQASSSLDHFFSQLEERGFVPYSRAGKLTGIQVQGGHKYRFSRSLGLTDLETRDWNTTLSNQKVQEVKGLSDTKSSSRENEDKETIDNKSKELGKDDERAHEESTSSREQLEQPKEQTTNVQRHPQHAERSAQLSSMRQQRNTEQGRSLDSRNDLDSREMK